METRRRGDVSIAAHSAFSVLTRGAAVLLREIATAAVKITGAVVATLWLVDEEAKSVRLAVFSDETVGTGQAFRRAALLAQQGANGLQYAHQLRDGAGRPAGLVHRDVNPSNIIITYHGMVKLLDFGVVKASTGNAKTSPGIFKGKYAYCAPEQLQGDTVDHRVAVDFLQSLGDRPVAVVDDLSVA